ncbi:ribosomal protein, L53 [Halocaridina rubra]|uniref:Large ribosomal subunit protein mL53 n=1 Tax=Halocaridina rubra TaxID=373956 RepID=A0AAN8WM54_HALRR
MALPYKHSGTFLRSAGIYSAIAKNCKILNLKPAKRIEFNFDPFGENVLSTRNVLTYLTQDKVRDTNPKCIIKTNVLCNRANPSINIAFDTGHKLIFKTQNLSTLEVLQLFNRFVSSTVKPEAEVSVPKTKAQKKKK